MYGGRGKDKRVGNGGPDRLYGGKGSDTLNGGGGKDVLDGGKHSDYIVACSTDKLVADGTDTVVDGC